MTISVCAFCTPIFLTISLGVLQIKRVDFHKELHKFDFIIYVSPPKHQRAIQSVPLNWIL